MPNYSYTYDIPNFNSMGGGGGSSTAGGSFNLPSFESIIPRDLISFLNNEKMRRESSNYGWQDLIQQHALDEQGRQANQSNATRNTELANALKLGLNDQDLKALGLKETGREFDVTTGLQRDLETAKQRYLDEVLRDTRTQAQFDRNRTTQNDWYDNFAKGKALAQIPARPPRRNWVYDAISGYQDTVGPNTQDFANTATVGVPRLPNLFDAGEGAIVRRR